MSTEGVSNLVTALTRAGHANFVLFDASGHTEHAAGIFDPFCEEEVDGYADDTNAASTSYDRERADLRCKSAFLLVQQCLRVLKPGEKLKKITAKFDACQYIASVVNIEGRTYGLVVRNETATTTA